MKTILINLGTILLSIIISIVIIISFKGCFELEPQVADNLVDKEHSNVISQTFEIINEVKVTATVYHAVKWQTNITPLLTASGLKIKDLNRAYQHRYIALSLNLVGKCGTKEFMYGDIVNVVGCPIEEYNGIWVVADTMNKRYTNYVDLLINPDMDGGKWNDIVIQKILITDNLKK